MMSRLFRALLVATLALIPFHFASAGLAISNFGGAPGGTWPGSPDGVASPSIAAMTAPNGGTVPQTVGTNVVIGQTFTVTSTLTVGSFAWATNASANNLPLSVHLFQFKTGSPYTPASGGYVPSSDLGPDLLGGGAGLTGLYPGSVSANVVFYDLSGSDEVTLAPGTYTFEIWNTTTGSGQLFPLRGAETYGGGSVYQTVSDINALSGTSTIGRNNVAGGTRDGNFAVYAAAAVPEASPLLLVGLGLTGCGVWSMRRRSPAQST